MATPDDNNHAAIPMRSATTASRNAQVYPHRNNHSLQNTEEEPKRPQPHPPHTRGAGRRFRAPASSPKQSPCNIHAAMTMRFAASRRKPARIYAHGNTRCDNNHAAIPMRSATTDSRNAQVYPHRNNHSLQNTEEEPKRPQPHPPHTRGTFHRRLQPLYIEKRKVSCSGCLPKQSPCNIHAAITLRFAASRRKPARIYAHGNTRCDNNHAAIPMRSATTDSRNAQVYPHRNNHSLQNTEEEPKRPQPHPPHTRGTFHRRPQPLTQKNTRFRAPASSPKQSPMQHSCSHNTAFRSTTSQTCTYLRTWQHCDLAVCPCARVRVCSWIARVPVCPCARGFLVCPCARGSAACPCARVPGGPLGDLSRGSPPATATSHGKTQGFVPRLPPQNKVHATFMQPLHCVSQHHVANLHVSMHMATPDDNNHAAITRGYCYVMSSPTPQSHTTLH